jgi:Trk K+ transport system NAD-binding subunit
VVSAAASVRIGRCFTGRTLRKTAIRRTTACKLDPVETAAGFSVNPPPDTRWRLDDRHVVVGDPDPRNDICGPFLA